MQNFTQKYAIVQLFENVPEGMQFSSSDWPLHATIVDVFAIDWDAPTIVANLAELLAHHAQAATVAGDDTFFGPDKQVRVVLLQKTDSLIELHNDVVRLLEKSGLQPNNPQYIGKGFVPHSTVQKHARLHKGDAISFNALTIIDMFPDNDPDQRKVLKTIRIGQ